MRCAAGGLTTKLLTDDRRALGEPKDSQALPKQVNPSTQSRGSLRRLL